MHFKFWAVQPPLKDTLDTVAKEQCSLLSKTLSIQWPRSSAACSQRHSRYCGQGAVQPALKDTLDTVAKEQ